MAEHSKLETFVEGVEAASNIGVLLAILNRGLGKATGNKVQLPPELMKKKGGIFNKDDEITSTKVFFGLKGASEEKRKERIDRAFRFTKYLYVAPKNPNRSTFTKVVLWVEKLVYSNDLYTTITRLEAAHEGDGEILVNMLLDKIEAHMATGKSEEDAFQAVYLEYKGSTLVPLYRVGEDEGQGDSLANRLGMSKENFLGVLTWATGEYESFYNWTAKSRAAQAKRDARMNIILKNPLLWPLIPLVWAFNALN